MFEEAYLYLLKRFLFLKNYLAILTISFIFSIKYAWKYRKILFGHIFSWRLYTSAVTLSVFSASFKKITISQRCCTMGKENGSYNEKSSGNFLVQLFYGCTQEWANSAKANKIDILPSIRLITHILF